MSAKFPRGGAGSFLAGSLYRGGQIYSKGKDLLKVYLPCIVRRLCKETGNVVCGYNAKCFFILDLMNTLNVS